MKPNVNSVAAALFLLVIIPFGHCDNDDSDVSPEVFFDPEKLPDAENFFPPMDLNITEFTNMLKADHPHAHLKVLDLIKRYDYVAEAHEVVTNDGYILEMHRIAGNKTVRSPAGKPAIFLMHGLLCSSMDWVIAGPERGLAFILADAGYDVWMGNARGNLYSRRHKSTTVYDREYWGFSWHEIGTNDLPAMINHALSISGQDKLFYVGHSQGSTSFFVMLTEHDEFNNKIRASFLLGPVVFCSHMQSPIFQFLARVAKPLHTLAQWIGQYEFKPSSMFFNRFKSLLCANSAIAETICRNVIFLLTGFNKKQFDMNLLPAIIAHSPAGSAVAQFVHYAQSITSGLFRKFDHGIIKNYAKYGTMKPPEYNLQKVRAPVALHYSSNDWLSHPKDVHTLYQQLPNPIGKFRVPDDQFNHIDYLWAKDVKKLVYIKMLSMMERY